MVHARQESPERDAGGRWLGRDSARELLIDRLIARSKGRVGKFDGAALNCTIQLEPRGEILAIGYAGILPPYLDGIPANQ
jgi:hypothetical protein